MRNARKEGAREGVGGVRRIDPEKRGKREAGDAAAG